MKLLRYGPPGGEKPGLLDASGAIRDLSGTIPDLAGDALAEFTALTRQALRTVRAVSGCHGFNLGMNQGAIAGAGVAEHLHQHVVPRWAGDANFFPIVARTKAVPQLLEDTRAALAEAWGGHAEEPARRVQHRRHGVVGSVEVAA